MRGCFLTIILLASTALNAQISDTVFVSSGLAERYLLYTDRVIYLAGEEVFLDVSGQNVKSKVLLVELLDSEGKKIQKYKFPIVNNGVSRRLRLSKNLDSGRYLLRAYTRYLNNFDSTRFTQKVLTIVNPDKPLFNHRQFQKGKLEFYFPDGKLIEGKKTKLVFSYIGMTNSTELRNISLRNNSNGIIQDSIPRIGDFGFIEFTPKLNEEYFLSFSLADGNEVRHEVNYKSKAGLTFDILSKDRIIINNSLNKLDELKIVAVNKSGKLISESDYFKPVDKYFANLSYSINETSKLFLINRENQIIANRFFYFTGKKSCPIQYKIDKNLIGKDTLIIQLDSISATFAKGNISIIRKGIDRLYPEVLVELMTVLPEQTAELIYSRYPNNILLHNICEVLFNSSLAKNIGKEFLYKGFVPFKLLPDLHKNSLVGKVVDSETGKGIPLEQVILTVPGNGEFRQVHLAITNSTGEFYIKYDDFSVDFLSSSLSLKRHNPQYKILLYSDYSTSEIKLPELTYKELLKASLDLNNAFISQQLQGYTELFDTTEQKSIIPNVSSYYNSGEIIKLKDFIDLPDLEEVINEIVPFTKVIQRKGHYYIEIFDVHNQRIEKNPFILLNNIPVSNDNLNILFAVHPESIESIRVVNEPFVLGTLKINPSLIINTTSGFNFPSELFNSVFFDFQGINNIDIPNFKDYSLDKYRSPYRSTLLWLPIDNAILKVPVKVPIGSSYGDYFFVIQGIDSEGNPFYEEEYLYIPR